MARTLVELLLMSRFPSIRLINLTWAQVLLGLFSPRWPEVWVSRWWDAFTTDWTRIMTRSQARSERHGANRFSSLARTNEWRALTLIEIRFSFCLFERVSGARTVRLTNLFMGIAASLGLFIRVERWCQIGMNALVNEWQTHIHLHVENQQPSPLQLLF